MLLFEDEILEHEEMVKQAMAMPLNVKIDKAIGMLGEYEKFAVDFNSAGYCLAFSGGKDSAVIAQLAEMAGVRHQKVYSVTTIDPPELVRHIKDNYDVVFNRQPEHLLTYLVDKGKGLPTGRGRWCCEIYKENTASGQHKILGVRAAESPRRMMIWKQIAASHTDKNSVTVAPVLYWTDKDVWDFLNDQSIKTCCLYKEGFSRIGCIGCPLAGAKQQKIEFARWPKYEKLWLRATQRFFDKWKNIPTKKGEPRWVGKFNNWQEYWSWWLREGNKKSDGCMGTLELWG